MKKTFKELNLSDTVFVLYLKTLDVKEVELHGIEYTQELMNTPRKLEIKLDWRYNKFVVDPDKTIIKSVFNNTIDNIFYISTNINDINDMRQQLKDIVIDDISRDIISKIRTLKKLDFDKSKLIERISKILVTELNLTETDNK